MKPDYLSAIQDSTTPEEAATMIRAFAARYVASVTCYSDAERVADLVKAELQAQALERGWNKDFGPKPWRRWLVEWGYTFEKSDEE